MSKGREEGEWDVGIAGCYGIAGEGGRAKGKGWWLAEFAERILVLEADFGHGSAEVLCKSAGKELPKVALSPEGQQAQG